MAHESLINWGRQAFEKGFSLEHIENHLLRTGMNRHDALKALHNITAFEHKKHHEKHVIRKELISIPVIILLILSALAFMYFAGILKW